MNDQRFGEAQMAAYCQQHATPRASGFRDRQHPAQDGQRIRIRTGDQTATATLNTSEARSRFVATLRVVHPHATTTCGARSTARIPGPPSQRTEGSRTHESGDLGYLVAPGRLDFAILDRRRRAEPFPRPASSSWENSMPEPTSSMFLARSMSPSSSIN